MKHFFRTEFVCQFVSVIALTWAEKQCAPLRHCEKNVPITNDVNEEEKKPTTEMPLKNEPAPTHCRPHPTNEYELMESKIDSDCFILIEQLLLFDLSLEINYQPNYVLEGAHYQSVFSCKTVLGTIKRSTHMLCCHQAVSNCLVEVINC